MSVLATRRTGRGVVENDNQVVYRTIGHSLSSRGLGSISRRARTAVRNRWLTTCGLCRSRRARRNCSRTRAWPSFSAQSISASSWGVGFSWVGRSVIRSPSAGRTGLSGHGRECRNPTATCVATGARLIGEIVPATAGADHVDDVGDFLEGAGLGGRFGFRVSALVYERLFDRAGILQSAYGTAEDSGGVGGYWLGVHS